MSIETDQPSRLLYFAEDRRRILIKRLTIAPSSARPTLAPIFTATMNIVSNTLLGIGLVMLTAYLVIGLVNHVGFVHRPFLLFIGGMVLLLAGLVGRYILPKL